MRLLTFVYVLASEAYASDESHLPLTSFLPGLLGSITLVGVLVWAGSLLRRKPNGAWSPTRRRPRRAGPSPDGACPCSTRTCCEHDVFLGFPGNSESAQEELDRAAARAAIVSFHSPTEDLVNSGARALVDRLRRPSWKG